MRIASEYFLRSIDLLTQIQGDKLISGLLFVAIWHRQMHDPNAAAIGIRELARQLHLPYETVRRHAMEFVRTGQCVSTSQGIAISTGVLRSRTNIGALRKIHLNVERMLADLTRAGLAKFAAPPARAARHGRLSGEQMKIVTIAIGELLAGIRMVGDLWGGDLLRGLVFTAIWTANVKHVTNTAPAAVRDVLPDELRLPVSILAISGSLRLPYETVRRHARSLEKSGVCVRAGRRGLVVPASTHRKLAATAVQTHGLVMNLLAGLRRAGVKT